MSTDSKSPRSHYRLRTTVANPIGLRLTRLGVSVMSRCVPSIAERFAMRKFLKPTGPRRSPPSQAPASITSHTLDGVELSVWNAGTQIAAESRGEGPVVLLVHGWSGSRSDMELIAAQLVGEGFRAVSVDFPAHGSSGGDQTTIPEMMRAITAVSAVVGPLEGIVAHSLGGAVATLALAERQLDARAVVLLAPAIGPIAFVERYRNWIGLPAALVPGMVRRVSQRAGRDVKSLDARIGARELSLPALIIHDPADREVPYEQGEAIAAAWQGSTLWPVQEIGHRRILTEPRVLRAVSQFLLARSSPRRRNPAP